MFYIYLILYVVMFSHHYVDAKLEGQSQIIGNSFNKYTFYACLNTSGFAYWPWALVVFHMYNTLYYKVLWEETNETQSEVYLKTCLSRVLIVVVSEPQSLYFFLGGGEVSYGIQILTLFITPQGKSNLGLTEQNTG